MLAAAGGAVLGQRYLSGITWPEPPVVTPGTGGGPPSDAVVLFDGKPVVDFDDDFRELSLTVNLTVPYLLCKAALPAMLAKRWGRIINVASINGKIGSVHGAAYAASKHGLLGLTRTLALEVARDGVTVNAICPGPVRTVMNDRRVAYDARRRGVGFEEQANSMTLVGGRLEPEDVAPLAAYLAGDEARMLTGQALNICGGICMS